MNEFLSRFDSGELLGLITIVGGLIFALAITAVKYWHDLKKTEASNRLKQDMLDRGMSPDEIKAVLEAGGKNSSQ